LVEFVPLVVPLMLVTLGLVVLVVVFEVPLVA
jgi:hypothetical protein